MEALIPPLVVFCLSKDCVITCVTWSRVFVIFRSLNGSLDEFSRDDWSSAPHEESDEKLFDSLFVVVSGVVVVVAVAAVGIKIS